MTTFRSPDHTGRNHRWFTEVTGLRSPDGAWDRIGGEDGPDDEESSLDHMELDRRRNLRVVISFLEHKKIFERCSPHTTNHYRQILDRFCDHIDGRLLAAITPKHIKTFLGGMQVGPSTQRVYRSNLATFFDWCVIEGVTKINPVDRVPVPKEPKRNPRGLRDDAIHALLAHCADERERVIIVLGVQQGLRCAEIADLEIANLDMRSTPMSMRVIGKGDKERILPITEETQKVLIPYVGDRQWGRVVVNHKTGGGVRPGTVGRIFREVRDRAGIPVVLHQLRHTCAHDMIHSGAHILDVQHALGHENLRTTQVYLPAQVGDLATAMGGRSYLDQ